MDEYTESTQGSILQDDSNKIRIHYYYDSTGVVYEYLTKTESTQTEGMTITDAF